MCSISLASPRGGLVQCSCRPEIPNAEVMRSVQENQDWYWISPHWPPGMIDMVIDELRHYLNEKGWQVNHKRVERIWRQEGLKVPKKQPKRGRLWLNDGSCIRLRPEHKDHIWSYDFVTARTTNGRAFRLLNIIDEYTRECLAILVARKIKSQDVIDVLFELFIFRGIPEHIRSDNGPEFTAEAVRKWLERLGVKTLFIEPGSPWENGYIESFNGKMRDELLNRDIFTTLTEAKVLIEEWRREYNQVRPHSSLGYRPPAPEAKMLKILTL